MSFTKADTDVGYFFSIRKLKAEKKKKTLKRVFGANYSKNVKPNYTDHLQPQQQKLQRGQIHLLNHQSLET